MSAHLMSAMGRTAPHQRDAIHRASTDSATLIAAALLLAVLIAEAVFVAFNAPSVADLGAAFAASVP